MAKRQSKSFLSAAKTIYAAFEILKAAGGEMRGSEVIEKMRESIQFTEWEKERYEKTGYIRWESIMHFYTIDCIKAGYLQKDRGIWILTPEGEEAMKQGGEELLVNATKAYRQWRAANQIDETISNEKEKTEDLIVPVHTNAQQQQALIEQVEEQALKGIQDFINSKNPYEFQDLVAALLRAMGWHIAFNAKRGKDGGLDIIAYSDPLGATAPRMKVQVKHRPNDAVAPDVVRQLVALLNKDGDVGLFVTSGRYTNDAQRYSRESHKHIELIDFEKFVSLWQEYYPQMTDEEKNMLPLRPIYFLGVNE